MTLAPRVEVFTQLSCSAAQHQHYNHTVVTVPTFENPFPYKPLPQPLSHPNISYIAPDRTLSDQHQTQNEKEDQEEEEEDPRILPSNRCLSNPVVQAGAARLQTIMTITMGGLSALTTGWWCQFGERYGRTRVLAITTFGLFLAWVAIYVMSHVLNTNTSHSDLTFIIVSTPHSLLAVHGHKLLIIAPFFEGLLGGWSTLRYATSAYLSDCTSPGSRAHIFSRFTGVFHLGVALGPALGAFLIRHPVLGVAKHSVTEVFWVAVACSFANFMLALFVFPESLSEEKRSKARGDACRTTAGKGKAQAPAQLTEAENPSLNDDTAIAPASCSIIEGFLSPLGVFLPVVVDVPGVRRRRRDWSLTFLACALFGYMLSTVSTRCVLFIL